MSIALQLVWRFSYTRWIRHLIYAVRLVLYNTVSVVKICYLVTKSCTTLLWPPCTVLIRLLCPRNSPDKNTGVSCHFLLQGIFPTQGSNPRLPHCRQTLTKRRLKTGRALRDQSQGENFNAHCLLPPFPLPSLSLWKIKINKQIDTGKDALDC